MSPALRKLALTAHVGTSVGWFGAVAAFVALAVVGVVTGNAGVLRGVYIAMDAVGWYVIVPASVGSLLTGLVQSLGTPWGLLRHYWVLVKLLLTVFATVVLLVHMRPVSFVARAAADGTLSPGGLVDVRFQLLVDAGAALVVLLVTTALSVYKPRGMTRFGQRQQRAETP